MSKQIAIRAIGIVSLIFGIETTQGLTIAWEPKNAPEALRLATAMQGAKIVVTSVDVKEAFVINAFRLGATLQPNGGKLKGQLDHYGLAAVTYFSEYGDITTPMVIPRKFPIELELVGIDLEKGRNLYKVTGVPVDLLGEGELRMVLPFNFIGDARFLISSGSSTIQILGAKSEIK